MEIKDLKQHIKDLMTAMGRSGTRRMLIKHEGFELELEREVPTDANREMSCSPSEQNFYHSEAIARHLPSAPNGSSTMTAERPPGPRTHQPEGPIVDEAATAAITSPMVGTFYTASSPESQPFIKVGDAVGKDDVVCIIEAMKVMNEIKAGISGTIVEILVSNGDPVEFGTKLFRVR